MTIWAACDSQGNCRKVHWDPAEEVPAGPISITASVGSNGANKSADVKTIQKGLNRVSTIDGGPQPTLDPDGIFGPLTGNAIRQFQRIQFPGWTPDGRIDPGQKTITRMNELVGGGGKQALVDPASADPSGSTTDPAQIQQAFTLAADALRRVRRASNRLTAVRSAYALPNPLFASKGEKRLVEWHFKVHRADNPVAQIDRVREV